MMKLSLLVIGMLCLSIVVCAGEVITNDTGEDATGLRVTFSEPVVITAFGDVLTSVDPLMMAYEFEFSGGVVEPGGSHWMNWAPLTGQVLSYEWMLQASKLADPNHSTEEEPDEGIALGSETQLGSETDAGYITWTGELVETKPKTITVVVYDESYIHDRFVGGENQPTVAFLVTNLRDGAEQFRTTPLRHLQVQVDTWRKPTCHFRKRARDGLQRLGSFFLNRSVPWKPGKMQAPVARDFSELMLLE